MTRIVVASFFVVLAIGILSFAIHIEISSEYGGILVNLATEIIGIAVTVAIVDWIFEKKRAIDEAKRIAWRALHDFDHAVWVWLGGSRVADIDEMVFLLNTVTDDDHLPHFTQNLFLQGGGRAQSTLQFESQLLSQYPDLRAGLGDFACLCSMRDAEQVLSPKDVRYFLKEGVSKLAKFLELQIDHDFMPHFRNAKDSAIHAQEWRHFGRIMTPPEPTMDTNATVREASDHNETKFPSEKINA